MATRYVMEQGVTYLIKEPKPDDSLKIFASLVKQGARGFCITRVHPKRIRKRFELGETPILWITTSEVADEKCVHPSDLAKLNMAINEMLRSHENLVILLEGIEYLVTYNGFDSILRFVQVINDRIMVTSSRFIMTLDPATLDSSSLHILERDLTPIEDLGKLEITFSEFPEAATVTVDRWKPQLEEKLRNWKEHGFGVSSLEQAISGNREDALKAFDQFEAYSKRAAAIEDELRGMDLEGFDDESNRVRGKLKDPATIKEAEDELVALQVAIERRHKDQSRRKGDEGRLREELRSNLAEWTSQGFITLPLSAVIEGPLEDARREFERFETAIRKLRELKEELLLIDTSGFEGEVESIRSRLLSPSRVSEVEDDIFRLKILIERRRKEERRKKQEDDRSRTDLASRLSQWRNEGFVTHRLDGWEDLPGSQARARFESFERDASALREIETELSTMGQRGLEDDISRVRKLLRDIDSLDEARTGLAELRSRLDRGQDEKRREEFERKIQEWKVLGYNTDRLREISKSDPDTIQKELVVFKIRVHRLKELEGELALLDTTGFGSEVAALMPLFKDVDRISDVESSLTELRIKIRNRSGDLRKKREDSGRRKRDLIDRMSVWLSQGYSVARLEELLDHEMDLDKIACEFDLFERDIVRLKELSGKLKTLDTAGFENDASEVRGMLSDLSRVAESELAVAALESRIRQSREDAKRQASEDEKRKRKAQDRIQAWRDQGLNVSRLEKALEEGMEVFKKEFSLYSLKLEKLRGVREELSQLDVRGFEPELESLQAKLSDIDNADSVEEGLRALRGRIDEKKERERREREAEKDERKSYIQQLLNWSSQGLVVESLERAIARPMEELRAAFDSYEKAVQRLDGIRRGLLEMDLSGLEAEADRVRLELNDPTLLADVEQGFAALRERAGQRDIERAESEKRERRRAEIRERVAKMASVGIVVKRMERFLDGDLETLENELDLFLEDIRKLRVLRKRFDAVNRAGLEERARQLEPMLQDPGALELIGPELEELELELARRNEAERASRNELDSKVEGWEKGGISVQKLREAALSDLPAYEKAVSDFEKDLDDYRKGMERVIRFQKDFIASPAPVAEKVAGIPDTPRDEEEDGKRLRQVGREVAGDVRAIRELAPHHRSAEERIRMEQRLRTIHRVNQRSVRESLAGRKALKRRRSILLTSLGVLVIAALVLFSVYAFILPNMSRPGLVIDGQFKDWDSTKLRSFQEDPLFPDNIDVRQTAVTRQGGSVFCYVKTYGTILKGTQNVTTKFYKGDSLRIYFDTDRTLSTGQGIEGIGADYMVNIYGWNNVVQEIDYLRYNANTPQVPWEVVSMPPSEHGRAARTQIEVEIQPGQFGLDTLPTDLMVIQTVDSEGNSDTVR